MNNLSELGDQFTIPGKPIAMMRARTLKSGRTYNPQAELKKTTSLILSSQHKSKKIYSAPLKLFLIFMLPIPKSKKKIVPGDWVTTRPDLDNYIKFILDAMQPNLITDDSQIVHLTAAKLYSLEPCTQIFIKTLRSPTKSDVARLRRTSSGSAAGVDMTKHDGSTKKTSKSESVDG